MRRVRLVVADQRPIVLQGLVSLLGSQPDFEVVACCLDGTSCLAAIRRLTPDVVLLEDGFTDVTASDILTAVEDEILSSRLVFFTATVTSSDLAEAVATGACDAISMNAKPEALVRSLRLQKSGSDLSRVGSKVNGNASFGSDVLSVLTVNERTIIDLVAEGLTDSEIAGVLGVTLEIVRIHIDHARQKLGINSRSEFTAVALSRRYGAMSTLAAAILAALDDSPGHAATEKLTVVAANGCAEVVTIKIRRKVTGGAPAGGAGRDRARDETGVSSPNGKFVDPVAEIAAGVFAQTSQNAARPASSSLGMYMVAAFAALIYELDGASHVAQALSFDNEIVISNTASDTNGQASALPGFPNVGGAAMYDEAFAFDFVQRDAIVIDGNEFYAGNVRAGDDGSDRENTLPQGSGSADVIAGVAYEALQTGSMPAKRDNADHGGPGENANHDQSQNSPHEVDNDSGAAKGHDKHEAEGDGDHGQSQKAIHESENGAGGVKGHDKHESAGEDSGRGQTLSDLRTFEDSPANRQHAQPPPTEDSARGKPQQSAVGTEQSDNFHFKTMADNTSVKNDLHQLNQGNGENLHALAGEEMEPVQYAKGVESLDAHHYHSAHLSLHAAHDLIV